MSTASSAFDLTGFRASLWEEAPREDDDVAAFFSFRGALDPWDDSDVGLVSASLAAALAEAGRCRLTLSNPH